MNAAPKTVLIAGITATGEVSLAFTASLLRMQVELLRTSNIKVSFEFFESTGKALKYFSESGEELFVCVNADMTVLDTAWLLGTDRDFVVAVYPTGEIDWKRVDSTIANTSEDPNLVGTVYSVDLADSTVENGRYVTTKSAGLGIFKVRRTVLREILENHSAETVFGPRAADLCALWGKDIHADISVKTINNCPVPFYGCVGHRKTLR